MSSNSELDRIINEGKVSSSTAMVIFAVELKTQGDKLDELKRTIDDDNKRYVPRDDFMQYKTTTDFRIDRLEKALLKTLITVFLTVLVAGTSFLIYQGVK